MSAYFLVGQNFSHSPIKTIDRIGFENFSRQKFSQLPKIKSLSTIFFFTDKVCGFSYRLKTNKKSSLFKSLFQLHFVDHLSVYINNIPKLFTFCPGQRVYPLASVSKISTLDKKVLLVCTELINKMIILDILVPQSNFLIHPIKFLMIKEGNYICQQETQEILTTKSIF